MLSDHTLSEIHASGARRLIVGFSGGMDSHVLLHSLSRTEFRSILHALHINHGLSPLAQEWQQHCREVCDGLGIGFTAIGVTVTSGSGVEARAREARYAAFTDFLGRDDLLLLAHHADDQVETALLTLFRGGNRPGISGMPRSRSIGGARLLRPMLDIRRADIEAYAARHQLHWITDESNVDIAMNRNYIRHEVLPVIQVRWPDVSGTLLKALARDAEFSQLIDIMGKNDIVSIMSDGGGVSVEGLLALSKTRRMNAVVAWLESLGLPIPGESVLSRELDEFLTARSDAAPLLSWQGICLRRFNDRIYLTGGLPEFESSAIFSFSGTNRIDTGVGSLSADVVKGRGIREVDMSKLEVRFRQGGERIKIGKHRTLKNVFQEHGVPMWLRQCMPLLFVGSELVAIPALPDWGVSMLVADGWAVGPSDFGLQLGFEVPGQPYTD